MQIRSLLSKLFTLVLLIILFMCQVTFAGSSEKRVLTIEQLQGYLNPTVNPEPQPLECNTLRQLPISTQNEQELYKGFLEAVGDKGMDIYRDGLALVKSRSTFRDCGLTDLEIMAILGYSGDGFYRAMNHAMRNNMHDELKKYSAIINLMHSGLSKLAPYNGIVNRGFDCFPGACEAFEEAYVEGKNVKDEGFLSASRNKVWDKKIQLSIQSKSCKYMGPLSFRNEEEVICLPGTQFQVVLAHTSIHKNPVYFRAKLLQVFLQEK